MAINTQIKLDGRKWVVIASNDRLETVTLKEVGRNFTITVYVEEVR